MSHSLNSQLVNRISLGVVTPELKVGCIRQVEERKALADPMFLHEFSCKMYSIAVLGNRDRTASAILAELAVTRGCNMERYICMTCIALHIVQTHVLSNTQQLLQKLSLG
jgi:hypothetical protein